MSNTKAKSQLQPRQAIARMEPYHPPSSGRSGKIRLDFNENTTGSSSLVIKRLRALRADELAVYPEYEEALPKLTRHFGVAPGQLTLTNGTDEAIQLVVNTFVNPGDRVVLPRPTYAMYRFYAQVMGAELNEVDYPDDLRFPAAELLRNTNSHTRAILIANPNNPTGTSASKPQLKALLEAAPQAAVLVDEAYFEFSQQTVLPWIRRYPNLFVSRTFSKAYGMAAMRVGCLFSNEHNMTAIRKGQSPYSVNSVGVAAALAAIRDQGYVKRYVADVLASRAMLCQELDRVGWSYFPSDANFVLVRFGSDARRVRDALAAQGILVRDRSYELAGCVRITVGTKAQTRKLVRALRATARSTP